MNKFLLSIGVMLLIPYQAQADNHLYRRVVHEETGVVSFIPAGVNDVDVQVDDNDFEIDIEAGDARPLLVKLHKQQKRCATGRGIAKNVVIGALCLGLVTLVGVGGYFLGKTGEGVEAKIEEIEPQVVQGLHIAQEIEHTGEVILSYADWNEIKALAQAANTFLPLIKQCPRAEDLIAQALEGTYETFCTTGS